MNLAALPVRPDDEVAVAIDQEDECLPVSCLSGRFQADFMTSRPISGRVHDFQAGFMACRPLAGRIHGVRALFRPSS